MSVEIGRERVGGVMVATISGRLDNESSADFELFVQEAVAGGERHLVLDLSKLGYISNAGVRAIGTLSKSLSTPSTSLRVAGLQPNVRQILDAAGVAILLDMRSDRAAALADHPAARGDEIGQHVMRLLGITPHPADATPANAAKLAELAFDLLSGKQHQNRAARAIAQGTQVMRRIAPTDVASAAAATPTAAPTRKLSFWQRLFGRKG